MSADIVSVSASWLGLVLILAASAAAFGALASRSMFAMSIGLSVSCMLASAALLALGNGDGALALALFGVTIAPVLLLGGVLLSAQTSKRRGRPWASVGLGALIVSAVVWVAAQELGAAPSPAGETPISPLWIAALVFVAAAACVGLLGYGERGALGRSREDSAP